MKKLLVFLFFSCFFVSVTLAQINTDWNNVQSHQIQQISNVTNFTIVTWEFDSIYFQIVSGFFWVKENNVYKKIETGVETFAKPIIVAKPFSSKYGDCPPTKCDNYLICIFLSQSGTIYESKFDIEQMKVVSVAMY